MKRFITILLLLILLVTFITACNDESSEPLISDSPTVQPTEEAEKTITPVPEEVGDPVAVTLVECQFYGDSHQNMEYKDAWVRLVEEYFGVPVTMITPGRSGYMETIQLEAMSGDLKGIVELFGGSYLEEWKAEGLIYPLTDFLAGNEVWNTIIPDYWKEAYTIDGEVWAIPTGSDGSPSYVARSMRGDWLDKFELEKPRTIDEFYLASYKFTYDDPNGSGGQDTTGFTTTGIFGLQDIFQAFDVRLNYMGEAKPAWNPNTEVWEDSLIKPEMVDCLEFLRKCYSEGVLDPKSFSEISGSEFREKMVSGIYGGSMYWDSWTLSFETKLKELIPESYFVSVGALSHFIDKNLNHYIMGVGGPRVLMTNTPQPKETINWYLNTFFGNEWGYWTGRLGPVGDFRGQEERACTVEDRTIIRNTYIDDMGSIKVYPSPGYVGGLPSRALYTEYEVAYHVPSPPEGFENWAEETAAKATANMARRKAAADEYIESGMFYYLPEKFRISPNSSNNNGKAGSMAIEKAITGEVSVQDALDEYKKFVKGTDMIAILVAENEKLGKPTTQNYD